MLDCLAALAWLQREAGQCCRLVVWGHSMGAALAVQTVARARHTDIHELVLESPFNNLTEEVEEVLRQGGGYRRLLLPLLPVSKLLARADLSFSSDSLLASLQLPVLLLHAEDDPTIPLRLAQRLASAAREGGKTNLRMEVFGKELGLGHNNIFRAEGLGEMVREELGLVEEKRGEKGVEGQRSREQGVVKEKSREQGRLVGALLQGEGRCEPRAWGDSHV